jgi:hypothetical protein
MVFPLPVYFPVLGTGASPWAVLVLGSIEQCGGPWQAAARYGRIVD